MNTSLGTKQLKTIRGILACVVIIPWAAMFGTTIGIIRLLFLACGQPQKIRPFFATTVEQLYTFWVDGNFWISKNILRLKIIIDAPKNLNPNDWYLMTPNHQSFADIALLQIFCNRRLASSKFFMKDILIFLPFIGIGCWGLEFIFVTRYKRKTLKKKPELLKKLNEKIDRQCTQMQQRPVTLINFIEGTRATPEKIAKLKSPYKHLLSPQAVGLNTMIRNLYPKAQQLLDISISYGVEHPTLWAILTGQIDTIHIHCQTHNLTADLVGNYQTDKIFRKHFRSWLNKVWQTKDQVLETTRSS